LCDVLSEVAVLNSFLAFSNGVNCSCSTGGSTGGCGGGLFCLTVSAVNAFGRVVGGLFLLTCSTGSCDGSGNTPERSSKSFLSCAIRAFLISSSSLFLLSDSAWASSILRARSCASCLFLKSSASLCFCAASAAANICCCSSSLLCLAAKSASAISISSWNSSGKS